MVGILDVNCKPAVLETVRLIQKNFLTAFGLGVERIVGAKFGISDIREFINPTWISQADQMKILLDHIKKFTKIRYK